MDDEAEAEDADLLAEVGGDRKEKKYEKKKTITPRKMLHTEVTATQETRIFPTMK